MTVYVDKLRTYPEAFGHREWCHLVADSSEELDNFAAKLGLKTSWKSNSNFNRIPHYDLTEGKRNQAIKMGVIEISDEDLVKLIRRTNDNKKED